MGFYHRHRHPDLDRTQIGQVIETPIVKLEIRSGYRVEVCCRQVARPDRADKGRKFRDMTLPGEDRVGVGQDRERPQAGWNSGAGGGVRLDCRDAR